MAGCAPYLYFHLIIWEFSQAKLAMVTLQKVYEFLPKWFFVLLLVLDVYKRQDGQGAFIPEIPVRHQLAVDP